MKNNKITKAVLLLIAFLLLLPFAANAGVTEAAAADADAKQTVYDFAGLLNKEEIAEIEAMAHEYGAKRETDFIIVTTNDTQNKDVVEFTEDFYDEQAFGYDKPHGNAALLTVDMQHREVYLAGFYKAEQYLDDHRLDLIRGKITPDLTNANYVSAFQTFIKTSYKYMGIRPGVSPDNILLNLWFQIIVSLGLAGIVVGMMVRNSGGKVTVTASTYQDAGNSGILQKEDRYIRTSVVRHKKPSNKSGGARGGGGISGGGHSHSGSRGGF